MEKEAQERLQQAQQDFIQKKVGRPSKDEAAAKPIVDLRQHAKAKGRLRRARHNVKSPTREYNFVDPDSRLMMDTGRNAFAQAYNAQAAVDGHAQVVVAAEITQHTNDRAQLLPMVQAVRVAVGSDPQVITADSGYWDTVSVRDALLAGINVLVTPDRKPKAPDAVLPAQVPHTEEARCMRERLASAPDKDLYAKRKTIVEPLFGQIKEARGFRRFRLRGLKRVAVEWKFICATHNLLKLFRYQSNLVDLDKLALA